MADAKEIAEHLMLIDLGRNDAGRVSETGSVKVTEKMVIERYSNVMHIVSNVNGQLKQGLSAMDALRAILPAGTLSGAPKIRAMEIIDELEPVKRGVYGGAVGYLAWNGNMDTAIAIRTAVIKNGELHVQAGGGIVADSVPALEWEETLNKRRAMFRPWPWPNTRTKLTAENLAACLRAGLARARPPARCWLNRYAGAYSCLRPKRLLLWQYCRTTTRHCCMCWRCLSLGS